MSQPCLKWAMGISLVLSVCGPFSHAATITDGHSTMEPAMANRISPFAPAATEAMGKSIPSISLPVENGLVLRTIPTMSQPISVRGTTLVPYIGAGFNGGYATELDRSLHTAPPGSALSSTATPGLRSLVGPQLIPNEIQLGIRVPF